MNAFLIPLGFSPAVLSLAPMDAIQIEKDLLEMIGFPKIDSIEYQRIYTHFPPSVPEMNRAILPSLFLHPLRPLPPQSPSHRSHDPHRR